MAYKKLSNIAEGKGVSIEEMMAELLNTHKTPYKISVELGVYEYAIRYWLKNNGYSYDPTQKLWTKGQTPND